jgi:hypothetical protein
MRNVYLADAMVTASEIAAAVDRWHYLATFKVGLWLLLGAAIAAAFTFASSSPAFPIVAGILLITGCLISAGAVENYRRVRK